MTTIILLFATGIILIAAEVIVPGGIIGAIGGVLMLIGCITSFAQFGTNGGLLAIGAATTIAILALWIEFRVLPRTAIGKRAFLTKQITGTSSAYGEEAQSLIGKSAEALTTLSPSGYILIDGTRYEAFCQSGHTTTGTPLTVIGADNFRLIVSTTATNTPL
jgi:membrane-bound ClpP family serine protease